MVEVYDNALPTALADKLENILSSNNFGWFLSRDIYKNNLSKDNVIVDKNTVNTIQLNHQVYDINGGVTSDIFHLCELAINIICQNLKLNMVITKIRLNMLFNHKDILKNKYNTPHIDNKLNKDNYSLIYYINDSDGDTVFFNEHYGEVKTNKLSIYKKITPKKNKAVIFDGSYFHASTNPINSENRIIMNVHLKGDINKKKGS